MIGIIILFIALGLGCGLWAEVSEQRRLGRAACALRKAGNHKEARQ